MYRTILVLMLAIASWVVYQGLTAEVHGDPADFPVVWSVSKEDGRPSPSLVDRISADVAHGVGPKAVTSITFDDQHPFGVSPTTDAWLMTFEVIVKRKATEGVESATEIRVVVQKETEQVIAVLCEGAGTDVKSMDEPSNAEHLAADNGWTWRGLQGERFHSSPSSVLGVLWASVNIAPTDARTIVLRPRFVHNEFPFRVVDGVKEAVLEPQVMWIVEVRGGEIMERTTPDGSEVMLTGLIAQIQDRDLAFVRGITTP